MNLMLIQLSADNATAIESVSQTAEMPSNNKFILLPTITGCRFFLKCDIVMFKYTKAAKHEKEKWEAILNTSEIVKLKSTTTAKEILKNVDKSMFLQTCQDTIVNIHYLYSIEFKTRKCILQKPFDNLDIIISRANLCLLKERFEI